MDAVVLRQVIHLRTRLVATHHFGLLLQRQASLFLLDDSADCGYRTAYGQGDSNLVVSVEAQQPQQGWTGVRQVSC